MGIKVISIFGTRPEAIKMAPVVLELNKHPEIESKVVVTGQHRELLDQVTSLFRLKVDYDLDVMKQQQTLTELSIRVLSGIEEILLKEKPDLVLVHGDTITAFVASLAAFYQKIPVGHVEAGLRTYDKYSPYPEEVNRQMIDIVADYYFAPTEFAADNLRKEGKDESRIFVTGNTVIDALLWVTMQDFPFINKELEKVDFDNNRVILLTTHRRENWGKTMEGIHEAVRQLVEEDDDVEVIFPVHPNPVVKQVAEKILGGHPRIHLLEPLEYRDMAMVEKLGCFVMTDSGGLQEEAPALDNPVLVLRDTTERPEGVAAGTLKLVGVNKEDILREARILLDDNDAFEAMADAKNPYGDGTASQQIVHAILQMDLGEKMYI